MEPDTPRIQVERRTVTIRCLVIIIIISSSSISIIIIIIIITMHLITIIQGIYIYTPETNHVYMV